MEYIYWWQQESEKRQKKIKTQQKKRIYYISFSKKKKKTNRFPIFRETNNILKSSFQVWNSCGLWEETFLSIWE